MRTRKRGLLPTVAFLIGQLLCAQTADQRELQLSWAEMAPLVHRREVALVMPSAVLIEGLALEVGPDAMLLDIRKTSDPRSYPKTETSIPRSAVSMVQLKRVRGNWRWLGMAIGGAAGAVAAWFVAEGLFHVSGEGLNPSRAPAVVATVGGLVAGAAAAGYFAGRGRDRHTTIIRVYAPTAAGGSSLPAR